MNSRSHWEERLPAFSVGKDEMLNYSLVILTPDGSKITRAQFTTTYQSGLGGRIHLGKSTCQILISQLCLSSLSHQPLLLSMILSKNITIGIICGKHPLWYSGNISHVIYSYLCTYIFSYLYFQLYIYITICERNYPDSEEAWYLIGRVGHK